VSLKIHPDLVSVLLSHSYLLKAVPMLPESLPQNSGFLSCGGAAGTAYVVNGTLSTTFILILDNPDVCICTKREREKERYG
jgi:hypothetical protein